MMQAFRAGFLEITRDISELIRLEEQLRQAAKRENLGVLAGGIAHAPPAALSEAKDVNQNALRERQNHSRPRMAS
jgi:hypothetical protein